MKKILLSLMSVAILSGGFAQSFSLQDTNGVAINDGATIQVIGDPFDLVITSRIDIKNNAAEAKDVKVKKVINEGDTLPLTSNYFCWGVCYSSDTYVSPFAQTIQPGTVSDMFYGDYEPKEVPGISTIMYVFFDVNNPDDSVTVKVEFNASPASVGEDLISQVKFSEGYPNPARETVKVDYSLPAGVKKASIVLTNMLGAEVKKIGLEDRTGTANIRVSAFLNGIYFYSLVVDEKLILTRKFVVKH